MVTNRIVTRGMGTSRGSSARSGLVTQGYSGVHPQFVVETIKEEFHRRIVGQSGTKRRNRELEHVIIWCKLVTVNDVEPQRQIVGNVRVNIDKSSFSSVMVEYLSSIKNKLVDYVKITIKRVR